MVGRVPNRENLAIRIVICSSVRKIAVTPQQRATAAFGNKWNVQLDSSLAVTTLKPLEEIEMKKLIVCGALAAFALGIQGASAAEFYIIRDATTKKCTAVDTKPTTTTTTVVGDGVYKTKTEAESAVKTTKVCTEQ
jgi:hypothetical protein